MQRERERVVALSVALLLALAPMVASVSLATVASASSGDAGPPGMTKVPDEKIKSKVPDHAQEKVPGAAAWKEAGGILAGKHGDDLEVQITTQGAAKGIANKCKNNGQTGGGQSPDFCDSPELALNLTDDVNHDGRRVAVPTSTLVDSLGYRPELAYGLHEDGSRWRSRISYQDDYAVIEVPKFSTNTVTFSGEVSIDATGAQDGSSWTYKTEDLDAVENYQITLTGVETTEWDNTTGSVDAGGSIDPAVAGNLEPSGPVSGEPKIEVTMPGSEPYPGKDKTTSDPGGCGETHKAWDGSGKTETVGIGMSTDTKVVVSVKFRMGETGDAPPVDVYAHKNTASSDLTNGTKVATNFDPSGSGLRSYNFSAPLNVTGWDTLVMAYVPNASSTQSDYVYFCENSGTIYHKSFNGQRITFSGSGMANESIEVGPGYTDSTGLDLSIDTSSVDLNRGESGNGSVDYDLRIKERQSTEDPKVSVNGHNTSYSGQLSPGASASITVDKSWIQEGSNQVNMTLPSPNADDPPQSVDMDYRHDSLDSKSVNYTAGTWIEEYNVSHTYAADRVSAELEIPFSNEIVKIRSIETRSNESGSWSTVISDDYTLSGTDLTVNLGSVDKNETVEIRVNATRVNARDGSIEVVDPAAPTEQFDTKFKIKNPGSNFRVEVGGDLYGDRLHYLYDESWASGDYVVFDTDGSQTLYAVEATDGDSARVTTLPVSISPESGDTRVSVEEASASEPELRIKPSGGSDSIEVTYYDTISGQSYQLYSVTEGERIDTDKAQSPVTFDTTDSDKVVRIEAIDGSGSGSESAGGAGGASPLESEQSNFPVPLPLLGVGLLLTGMVGYVVVRGESDDSSLTSSSASGSSGLLGSTVGRAGGWVSSTVSSTVSPILGNRWVAAGLGVLGVFVGIQSGLIPAPSGGPVVLGVLLLVGLFVGLRRIGSFNPILYGVVAVIIVIWVLESISPGGVVPAIADGVDTILPLLAIGGLVLAYQALQAWRSPNEKNVIQIGGEDGSD